MADLPGENPVIALVEAGHVDSGGKCAAMTHEPMRPPFPCPDMVRARREARERVAVHATRAGLGTPRFGDLGRRYG